MKRSISLVLCLAMLISVFSCLGITASAEVAKADPKTLFTVKSSGFKNDKITYTVYLNKGVNLSGAIVYASFDSKVLAIDKANSGAYMVDDGDGGVRENISGMYESDFMAGYDNRYSIAHAYGQEADYKNGSSNKPYLQFTFKAIDANRPKTEVRLYCYEFNSASIPENNIPNGSSEEFYLFNGTTLSETVISSVQSQKDGVKISWQKTTGADYYRVSKKIDGSYKVIETTIDGDVTSFIDKDVKNNTSYTYTVRALNEAGLNSCYDKAGVTTRYTVAPTTLKVVNANGKIDVSWSKVAGATGYRVYKRTVNADGTKSKWTYSSLITGLKYSDTKVTSGTTYEYAVRVYSNGGSSAVYSEKAIIYLAKPTFTIKANTAGVNISWNKVAGAQSYKIYRKEKGGSWKLIKSVSGTETSYTDRSAPSGKYVYYGVKAANGSYISVCDNKAMTYMKTPTINKIVNVADGVKISWYRVGGATSYYVYRKAGNATSWTKIATTKTGSYTDKNVKSGTNYKYCIRSVGSAKSAFGGYNYKTIRFLSAPKLGKITSAKSGVTINWGGVNGANGYTIYRKAGSGSFTKLATVKGKTTVKYLDKTAKKGTTYSYRVYATYGSYTSSYKSALTIKDKY